MNAEESYNYWQPHNWATKLSKNPIMLTKEQAIRFAEAYAADTLAELKRVKEAAQAVLDNIGHNPCSADISTELNNLKKTLGE